jgi:hypothetical protein
MDQTVGQPFEAATDEPASHSTAGAHHSEAQHSGQLTESLIEDALDAGRDPRPGWGQREDGWTPERICTFLRALTQSGVVAEAARAAGMSRQSAYALRARASGRAFQLAWRAAFLIARQRLADELMARAIHGQTEKIVRDGKVWGERHRHDNRLGLAMLARFDRQSRSDDEESAVVRFVAEEFEQFLEIASADGKGAVEFVESRKALGYQGHGEGHVLERLENYRRYRVGLPGEIDISDLDPNDRANWTEEQAERAERSCFLDEMGA